MRLMLYAIVARPISTVHLAETAQGFNVWSSRYTTQMSALIATTEELYQELLHKMRKHTGACR
jgi:TolB-like protein